LAKKIFYQSVSWGVKENYLSALGRTYNEFAKLYIRDQNKDSALYYANKSISILLALGSLSGTEYNLATAYEVLIKAFQLRNQSDSAYKYQQLALRVKDSIYVNRINNLASFYNLTLKETLRLQNIEKEKKIYQEKVRVYALLLGLGIVFLIAIALFRINHQRKLVNKNLEQTLVNLKATQSQLIQSEKMASLGELTAGIAHEIQNPLNFVNNFSEVNKELLAEMNEEIDKGNFSEVKAIAKDITENEVKINHHGKRADAIVKGMLQHSRSSNGVKEPTDINNLADEYFRLAYHGLRAKDKSFNATMKTEFDGSVGNVNIISQDIGRVILNLITNAFYAVTDRKKKNEEGYEPTVSLSTQKTADKVIIKVRDNGNGIPEKVKEKIFLPFFTTKPTGEGTGLGLSMSYDIVTKGHGGELSVTTEDGKYTEFSIVLPIQQT
jgi:signal transduction histidine kinase